MTGLDSEKELPILLGRLAAFVPVRDGRYSLFHRSLYEWLTGWNAQSDQPHAGSYHISLQDGHRRLAEWDWSEYEHGIQSISPYCLRHLVAHLHQANQNDNARKVVLDFQWLQAKLEATDINALIADYSYLPEETDLRAVQYELRQTAHILVRNPRELPSQLLGRVPGRMSQDIDGLRTQASKHKSFSWLRPLSPSLIPLDTSIVRTLEGHTESVDAVALTPDGRCVVSGSKDKTLRVWDLESGQTLWRLGGSTSFVRPDQVRRNRRFSGFQKGSRQDVAKAASKYFVAPSPDTDIVILSIYIFLQEPTCDPFSHLPSQRILHVLGAKSFNRRLP